MANFQIVTAEINGTLELNTSTRGKARTIKDALESAGIPVKVQMTKDVDLTVKPRNPKKATKTDKK